MYGNSITFVKPQQTFSATECANGDVRLVGGDGVLVYIGGGTLFFCKIVCNS